MMALAGSVCRTAPSTAHPGGVVAGRQNQHDCESENSMHNESRSLCSKNHATLSAAIAKGIGGFAPGAPREFSDPSKKSPRMLRHDVVQRGFMLDAAS